MRNLQASGFVFVLLVVLCTGLAAAKPAQPLTPAPATPVQPAAEANPVALWLLPGALSEVCYDSFNGCQPEAPGPCCWRCAGGSGTWSCTTASSATQCRSKCATACGTACGWI